MPEEKNIKLILEYDGSGYHGWQRQVGMTTGGLPETAGGFSFSRKHGPD